MYMFLDDLRENEAPRSYHGCIQPRDTWRTDLRFPILPFSENPAAGPRTDAPYPKRQMMQQPLQQVLQQAFNYREWIGLDFQPLDRWVEKWVYSSGHPDI